MGKQINFFMDEETERKFFDYLLNSCVIYGKAEGKLIPIKKLPEMYTPFWFSLYLHKKEIGDMIINTDENRVDYIDDLHSCGIEYIRSTVDEDKKIVKSGRLYLIMKYYGDGDAIIKKPPELEKWYNTLVRWIKKNVPYQEYSYRYIANNGKLIEGTDKAYFNNSIKQYVENSYS